MIQNDFDFDAAGTSERFKSNERPKEEGKANKQQLNFKVVKDVKRKPKGKTGRAEYTLDCERRLFLFKQELNAKLTDTIGNMGGSFEDHYQRVIDKAKSELRTRKKKRFERMTEPKGSVNINLAKGRYIYDQDDVMQLPILHLDEQTIKEIYGEKKLQNQDYTKLAEKDDFI